MANASTVRGLAEAEGSRASVMLLQHDPTRTTDTVQGSRHLAAARQGAVRSASNVGPSAEGWKRSQVINAARGRLMIRPFSRTEFGNAASAPSAAQLMATNALMDRIRSVVEMTAQKMAASASQGDTNDNAAFQQLKSENTAVIADAERVWQFYWEILSQRQTFVAPMLLAADRVALDCYQWIWQGLGRARSVPTPPPFTFLESGIGPATYRRGVTMARIGRLPNPFPLIKLPYHRMATPWTLGALPHEVGHNLQSDLGLWLAVPRALVMRFTQHGLPRQVRMVWVRWCKEIWADLIGVLLIGPSYIGSLMDVVGRNVPETMAFSPRGVHPIPWLRVLINLELLQRMGFEQEARAYRAAWLSLYPPSSARQIPPFLRESFARAVKLCVDTVAFTPYPQLGGKTLQQVIAFRPQDQQVAIEAARRLGKGTDPGINPERFLIAAARIAFDRRYATPSRITQNFYMALGRR